jgi:hypothetical protein
VAEDERDKGREVITVEGVDLEDLSPHAGVALPWSTHPWSPLWS